MNTTTNSTILALDLGTHTGWALHQLDSTITSGTEHFKPQRFEGGGMRFLRFKRWLAELLTTSGHINAVYFEEVRRHAGVAESGAVFAESGKRHVRTDTEHSPSR